MTTPQTAVDLLPEVWRHARSIYPVGPEAEALLVETLKWAILHAEEFDPDEDLHAWLIEIMTNIDGTRRFMSGN